jgi:hypothetical protein
MLSPNWTIVSVNACTVSASFIAFCTSSIICLNASNSFRLRRLKLMIVLIGTFGSGTGKQLLSTNLLQGIMLSVNCTAALSKAAWLVVGIT